MTSPSNTSPPNGVLNGKVENWTYPFPLADEKGAPSLFDYLKALAVAPDGTYPFGSNGMWHGGVHFGAETWSTYAQDDGVRCIADGEVVAYRLDSKLQSIEFPENHKAGYSAGFTLVRHQLVLPPLPTPVGTPTNAPSTPSAVVVTPQADVLVFFSLYMHTLCWDTYDAAKQAGHPKPVPAFYYVGTKYSVGEQAQDRQAAGVHVAASHELGLHIASAAKHGRTIGWIPRGTVIEFSVIEHGWGKISGVSGGTIMSPKAGTAISPAAKTGWVPLAKIKSEPVLGPTDQVVVLTPPAKIHAGDVVAHVGEFQRLVEANEHGTLPPHVGERVLLHVEAFTGQDLPAYIARSQQRISQIPSSPRSLLLISTGAQLVQPASSDGSIAAVARVKETADSPSSGPWCQVRKLVSATVHHHQTETPSGDAFWIQRADLPATGTEPRKTWTRFPLDTSKASGAAIGFDHVTAINGLIAVQADSSHTWYHVITAVDATGAVLNGWVCSNGQNNVALKSPWDWPGFDVEAMTTSVSDMFKRALHIADKGEPDEIDDFEVAFDTSRSDSAIKKLESLIDAQGQLDGKITSQDLSTALTKPWLADLISRLVIRYESEWGGPMSKWEALTPLMHAGQPAWDAELKRIDSLRIWDKVDGIGHSSADPYPFPTDANVYHWHPFGLIDNFRASLVSNICQVCGANLTLDAKVLKKIFSSIGENAEIYPQYLNASFVRFRLDTCARVSHFLGQAGVETNEFTSMTESLNYTTAGHLWDVYHHIIIPNMRRTHPSWTVEEIHTYSDTHLVKNSDALSAVLFGSQVYPGADYRGRGPLNLTLEDNYRAYSNATGKSIMANPSSVASDPEVGCDTSAWYWARHGINDLADKNTLHDVTHAVNTALLEMQKRGAFAKAAFAILNSGSNPCAQSWTTNLTGANGWT